MVFNDQFALPEWHSAFRLARMRELNLPTDPVASRERFATSRRQPHGNREDPTFLSVSIGRRESRPSSLRRWGAFRPSVVFAKDGLSCHDEELSGETCSRLESISIETDVEN